MKADNINNLNFPQTERFSAQKNDVPQDNEAEKWKRTNIWDVAAGIQGCAYMN